MNNLILYSNNRINDTPDKFRRYLFAEIDWDYRLVGITGSRGVGKTTIMLQYLKSHYHGSNEGLYVSMDSFYFSKTSLFELAEEFYVNGGKHLFIDEVHRYPQWSVEIKSIYDNFPKLKLVFSGSSALQVSMSEADLSRRASIYRLEELSFREFIEMKYGNKFDVLSLEEILNDPIRLSRSISKEIRPVAVFNEYLEGGCYPWFFESTTKFNERLLATTNVIIEIDMASIENFSYASLLRMKKVLALIADSVPFKPNISELGRKAGVSRDILLRMIDLLERSGLLMLLREQSSPTSYLTKPDKIYLRNTALFHALSLTKEPEIGTLRETFFVNQLSTRHRINTTKKGDFVVDSKYIFEVGGRNKSFRQIAGIQDAYLVKDGIESATKNIIPLWLFGFLY